MFFLIEEIMTQELIINMFYAAPAFWIVTAGIFLALIITIFALIIRILKLNQKRYFLKRDRNRYIETLAASIDGFFAFVYPDAKVNDPITQIKENCSRRLAVILNLEKGTKATLTDILNCFYKDDAKKISKYIERLKEDGVAFDDDFKLKNEMKNIKLVGRRIAGNDANIFCDMIWFRDITNEKNMMQNLLSDKQNTVEKIEKLEAVTDNASYPIWVRDEQLNIIYANKRYMKLFKDEIKNNSNMENLEIKSVQGKLAAKNLAWTARTSGKEKEEVIKINIDGQAKTFKLIEAPFSWNMSLEKNYTIGTLFDISEYEEVKQNLKIIRESQLDILGTLGNTAFAVFDKAQNLSFSNKSFISLWKIEVIASKRNIAYSEFLDIIREKRLLPEVANFKNYKEDEIKAFNNILEPTEDMMHLPDGRTIRRVRAPYLNGGMIVAFEDITDKLAATRRLNAIVETKQQIIDNVPHPILIIDSSLRLGSYNESYIKLWNIGQQTLSNEPTIYEILDSQRRFFEPIESWSRFKEELANHIIMANETTMTVTKNDGVICKIKSAKIKDESIMVIYHIN